MKSVTDSTCELCERPVAKLTVHHLVPRSRSKEKHGIPTVKICAACHRQLHALFSNHELARSLHSLEQIKRTAAMQKFLSWVRKQDPNKRIRVKR